MTGLSHARHEYSQSSKKKRVDDIFVPRPVLPLYTSIPVGSKAMCQYENIHYGCGHAVRRLIKHCHFARNDPNHQCFGAWSVKREWSNPTEYCRNCAYYARQRTFGHGR
ncbi:hypothetical protein VTO58DRAFT_103642 [Aureobasidium pullulans]